MADVTVYFKMRALDDTQSYYVTWVVSGSPDPSGTYAPEAIDAGSAIIAAVWSDPPTIIIPSPGGGGGIVRVAPDSNDVAIWQLNEASAPFANSGSGAATAMSVSAGSITGGEGERGEFGTAALVPETLCTLATSTAVPEPTQDITVSFWIFLFEYVSSGSYGRILMKQSDPSSWVSPYYSLVLYFTDALGTGRSIVRTATGSSIVEFSSGTVPLFQWNHLGFTYDGTTSRLYLNGSEIGNNSDGSGNMDWTDHGYWLIGSPVGQSTNWIHAMYQDIRIADVVRDAAWFEEVFAKGWG